MCLILIVNILGKKLGQLWRKQKQQSDVVCLFLFFSDQCRELQQSITHLELPFLHKHQGLAVSVQSILSFLIMEDHHGCMQP